MPARAQDEEEQDAEEGELKAAAPAAVPAPVEPKPVAQQPADAPKPAPNAELTPTFKLPVMKKKLNLQVKRKAEVRLHVQGLPAVSTACLSSSALRVVPPWRLTRLLCRPMALSCSTRALLANWKALLRPELRQTPTQHLLLQLMSQWSLLPW